MGPGGSGGGCARHRHSALVSPFRESKLFQTSRSWSGYCSRSCDLPTRLEHSPRFNFGSQLGGDWAADALRPMPHHPSLPFPLGGRLMADQPAEMALGHGVITRPTHPFSSFRRSPLPSVADRVPWPPAPAVPPPLIRPLLFHRSINDDPLAIGLFWSLPRCPATNIEPATGLPSPTIGLFWSLPRCPGLRCITPTARPPVTEFKQHQRILCTCMYEAQS